MSTTVASDLPATPAPLGGYRWVVCALLFFATTVNYVDRQILALIKEFLDAELGWSNEQFGLVNSAFAGAYAVGLLVFVGRLVRSKGRNGGVVWVAK